MANPTLPPQETPSLQPSKPRRSKARIVLAVIAGVLLVSFVGIQLIPVGRANPATTSQIQWDSAQTEALAREACMDCHSNETTWPWYSYVAPVSWLIYYDVQRGRSVLNFSTLGSSSSSGEGQFNPFGQQSGDLAYQLGQILAGGSQRGPGGQFPGGGQFSGGGQFPTRAAGQQPPGGGQFPGGGFGGGLANRLSESINNGQMPPANYTLIHPSAALTSTQRQQLLQGLLVTLGLQAK